MYCGGWRPVLELSDMDCSVRLSMCSFLDQSYTPHKVGIIHYHVFHSYQPTPATRHSRGGSLSLAWEEISSTGEI